MKLVEEFGKSWNQGIESLINTTVGRNDNFQKKLYFFDAGSGDSVVPV